MSAITPAIRPAVTPAIRSAFDGGAPSLLAQSKALVRKYGGALYDPSNMASLFQDSAGTIPVTAADQPVGLMLDVSQPPGPDTAVNGNFASDLSGWTQTAPNYWQWVAGSAFHPFSSAYNSLQQAIPTDKSQEITASLNVTSGTAMVFVSMPSGVKTFPFTAGQHTFRVITEKGSSLLGFARSGAGAEFYVDNVTVRAIPGFHVSQSTTTARPTYQIVDGYPCIVGDGVDDLLSTAAISTFVNPAHASFVASKFMGVRTWGPLISVNNRKPNGLGNGSTAIDLNLTGSGTPHTVSTRIDTLASFSCSAPPVPTDVATGRHVLGVTWIQAANPMGTVYMDGTIGATGGNALGTLAFADPMYLVLLSGDAPHFYARANQAIFGGMYVNGAITAAERLAIQRFLASRAGVTL